jgi:leucyl-tRNA synthetase
MARFREEQLKRMGAAFDWSREVDTTNPRYYKWTQWIFIQLFKAGLAYRAKALVNWCPKDLTVLADEQVIEGRCERCGTEVIKRDLEQWFFRITAYAERLLDHSKAYFTETTKTLQRNRLAQRRTAWFSRSPPLPHAESLEIFNTRPTLWVQPSWFLCRNIRRSIDRHTDRRAEVTAYAAAAERERDRTTKTARAKTGVFTGGYAINPANDERSRSVATTC